MTDMTVAEEYETVIEAIATEETDWFQIIAAVLIAVVTVAGAIVAWRAALIDAEAGDADFVGMRANINAVETGVVNTNLLYEHYRAYTAFSHNRRLQRLLGEALDQADEAEWDDLDRQWAIAAQLASDNEAFFSKRYLNQDGSYNSQRQLGEAWAAVGERLVLNPEPYFAEADRLRAKSNLLIAVFIVQTFALLFYTIAEGLHPSRNILRYMMAGGGTVFLLFSLVAAVLVEIPQ